MYSIVFLIGFLFASTPHSRGKFNNLFSRDHDGLLIPARGALHRFYQRVRSSTVDLTVDDSIVEVGSILIPVSNVAVGQSEKVRASNQRSHRYVSFVLFGGDGRFVSVCVGVRVETVKLKCSLHHADFFRLSGQTCSHVI